MVAFDDLLDARLSEVEATAAAWRAFAATLKKLEHDAVSDFVRPLRQSTWEGEAANAAAPHIDGIDDGLGVIAEQARSVAVLVDTAASRWAALQRQLHDIQLDAKDAGAWIRGDGSVEPAFLSAAEALDERTAATSAARHNAAAQQLADRIASVLIEATRVDEEYSAALNQYTNPPSGMMSAVEILDAGLDARDNSRLLGADPSVIPSGKSAWTVREWWEGLNADQRQAYLAAYPDRIGALNGIPAVARDQANRERALQEIAHLERAVTNTGMGPAATAQLRTVRQLWQKLEASEYGPPSQRLYLLGFDPAADRGDGRAIVAIGNPDTAEHVATMVPGLDTELNDVTDIMLERAGALQKAADDITTSRQGDVSVIAWLDYDAPETVAQAGGDDRATQGAARLDAFVNGLHATHDGQAHYSVVAHSYGSTTAGTAAGTGDGLAIDDLVVAGSPGLNADHATDLHIDRHHVWAGAAPDDPVVNWTSGLPHGANPVSTGFGANVFHVDTHGHGDYWATTPQGTPTQSLASQAAVVAGDYGALSSDNGSLDRTSDESLAAQRRTDSFDPRQQNPVTGPR